MKTCTKRFSEIPFNHRQWQHKGHCAFLHGHGWSFEFEFSATELDACGFVVDFGGLKSLKDWLEQFDHGFVVCQDDPELWRWKALYECGLVKLVVVPDCSAEGLAEYAFQHAERIVGVLTKGRARVVRCTVYEDSRNSATFRGKDS